MSVGFFRVMKCMSLVCNYKGREKGYIQKFSEKVGRKYLLVRSRRRVEYNSKMGLIEI
jgi:hypothetical protein